MIRGLEIAMIVWGIYILVTGNLSLGKNRVVMGPPARKLAFILLAPVPVAYIASGAIHAHFVTQGKPVGTDSTFVWTMIAAEAGIVLLCFGAFTALAWVQAGEQNAIAQNPSEPISPSTAEPLAPEDSAKAGVEREQADRPAREPPLAVCDGCGIEIRRPEYDRIPPWCPRCGKDLKRS
jgi:hypothetical protein